MTQTVSPWVDHYIGTPWIEGKAECWHLVVKVLRRQFGIRDLPLAVASNDHRVAVDLLASHPERENWSLTDEPQEGDVVMMRRGVYPCHVGVWVAPNHVLHSLKGSGAILSHTTRLIDLGYKIAGVYRRTA